MTFLHVSIMLKLFKLIGELQDRAWSRMLEAAGVDYSFSVRLLKKEFKKSKYNV